MERISSGIPGLDALIQGGFPAGSNILLIGPPMSGKSTIAMQFIHHGLTLDEAGIFVSTNDAAETVQRNMLVFGWDTAPFEKRGAMKFVDCYSMMLDAKISDTYSIRRIPSALAFTRLNVVLSELCAQFWKLQTPIRVALDSVSSLLMYANPEAVTRFLHVLGGRLKKLNAVNLLILEKGMHDARVETTLQQLSDGVINLRHEGKERSLEILGLTGTRCPEGGIPFEITEKGIQMLELTT